MFACCLDELPLLFKNTNDNSQLRMRWEKLIFVDELKKRVSFHPTQSTQNFKHKHQLKKKIIYFFTLILIPNFLKGKASSSSLVVAMFENVVKDRRRMPSSLSHLINRSSLWFFGYLTFAHLTCSSLSFILFIHWKLFLCLFFPFTPSNIYLYPSHSFSSTKHHGKKATTT